MGHKAALNGDSEAAAGPWCVRRVAKGEAAVRMPRDQQCARSGAGAAGTTSADVQFIGYTVPIIWPLPPAIAGRMGGMSTGRSLVHAQWQRTSMSGVALKLRLAHPRGGDTITQLDAGRKRDLHGTAPTLSHELSLSAGSGQAGVLEESERGTDVWRGRRPSSSESGRRNTPPRLDGPSSCLLPPHALWLRGCPW